MLTHDTETGELMIAFVEDEGSEDEATIIGFMDGQYVRLQATDEDSNILQEISFNLDSLPGLIADLQGLYNANALGSGFISTKLH